MTQEKVHRVIVSGTIGGGGPTLPGMGGGGAPAAPAITTVQSPNLNLMAQHLREISAGTKGLGGTIKAAGKEMGIKFTLGGVLKQSQLFTGMIGSLFQIAGAAVDIFLATFMPILIPAIRRIASILPILKSFLDVTLGALVRWVVKGVSFIFGALGGTIPKAVGDGFDATARWAGVNDETAREIGDKAEGATKGVVIGIGSLLLGFAALKLGMLRPLAGIGKILGVNRVLSLFFKNKFMTDMIKGLKGLPGMGKLGGAASRVGRLFGIGGKGAGDAVKAPKGRLGKFLGGLNKTLVKPQGGILGRLGMKGGVKLIPGIGSAIYAYRGVSDGIKNFNEARSHGQGLWKSIALGSATATAGLTAAAVAIGNPMAGLALDEAGRIGVNAMMNQWSGNPAKRNLLQGTLAGSVADVVNLVVNVNGQTEEDRTVAMLQGETDVAFASGNVTTSTSSTPTPLPPPLIQRAVRT